MAALLLLRHATRPFASLHALGGSRIEAASAPWILAHADLLRVASGLTPTLHEAAGPRGDGADAGATHARLAILAIKRAVHNRRPVNPGDLEPAAIVLPPSVIDALDRYGRVLAAAAEIDALWENAFLAELAAGRRAIAEAARNPLVAFGLLLASRPLLAKVEALDASDAARWSHGERHVAAKALAYIARFATKTSPNAVFCATALASAVGDRASVSGGAAIARRDSILNVAEARKVACVLAADAAIEAAIVPRPNPTLREDDGALTFWKLASPRHENDEESFSRAKDHPVLRAALDEARAGVPLPELRRRIAARCELDEAEVAPFLRQVVDRGLLVAEIEIPYNERRPLRFVAQRAREAGCTASWIEAALAIEKAVDGLADASYAEQRPAMARIDGMLAELPHRRPIKTDELFRVDTASGLDVTLPSTVIDSLREGLRPYARLFATLYPARRFFQVWIDRFLEKFPADADVELLDVYRAFADRGEGDRPVAFPDPGSGGSLEADRAQRAMAAVRGYLTQAAREHPARPIALDDAVIDRLVPDAADPRWASGVLFQLAARDAAAITRGDYLLVLNGIFHGAGLSLSRFAHLLGGPHDDDRNPVVRELRRAWSIVGRPGARVAEVTYNHMARTANAGLRPALFADEIELPGDRASPGAHVHALRDLTVRFETASGRFLLRAGRDGCELIPIINSGVNPVGFVAFLVAIGEQSLQPIGYFPGFDDPGVTHWPRVLASRLVLFREHWAFRAGEWPEASERGDDLVRFARGILSWRARWGLPRHVFVHTTREPKPRYVDLDSPVFLDLLRRDVAALGHGPDARLHVTEMLPGPDEQLLQDGNGGYASELLIQMHADPVGSRA